MVRRPPADDCMFCAPDPCVCNAKKAPARTARKTIQSVPITPQTVAPAEQPRTVAVPVPVVEQPAASRPRASGLRAVKSLSPPIARPAPVSVQASTPVQTPAQTRGALRDVEREDAMTSAIRIFAEAGLVDADELMRHRTELRMTDPEFEELLLKVRGM